MTAVTSSAESVDTLMDKQGVAGSSVARVSHCIHYLVKDVQVDDSSEYGASNVFVELRKELYVSQRAFRGDFSTVNGHEKR